MKVDIQPAASIHPCWFCGSGKVYVDAHVTRQRGDSDDYIAQVRCRFCCARGPKVKFAAHIEHGFPDLDRSCPNSSVSVACNIAIQGWNRGPQVPGQ